MIAEKIKEIVNFWNKLKKQGMLNKQIIPLIQEKYNICKRTIYNLIKKNKALKTKDYLKQRNKNIVETFKKFTKLGWKSKNVIYYLRKKYKLTRRQIYNIVKNGVERLTKV
jgi:Mor family transcriptional regulator